ncbi:MAG: hypothetical protein HYX20_01020 [Candidatus Yanofskybacteria bacterium]|nr:hypothetical protein [Candidatus Yanofskybacteria bacterium]
MRRRITQNLKPGQEGVAVIFAILLMDILLTISLTLSAIFIPKIRVSSDVKSSVGALYAAESGIEWCLYINRVGSTAQPTMSNGATFINGATNAPFIEADCAAFPIKSTGTYRGVTRSFEVNI